MENGTWVDKTLKGIVVSPNPPKGDTPELGLFQNISKGLAAQFSLRDMSTTCVIPAYPDITGLGVATSYPESANVEIDAGHNIRCSIVTNYCSSLSVQESRKGRGFCSHLSGSGVVGQRRYSNRAQKALSLRCCCCYLLFFPNQWRYPNAFNRKRCPGY